MYADLTEVSNTLQSGLGMNNLSRKIFTQFKELNNLIQYEPAAGFRPQAVLHEGQVKGFTVVCSLVQMIAEGKQIGIRQNYSYDAVLVADLTTGLVFELDRQYLSIGAQSRHSAAHGYTANRTEIPLMRNIRNLRKTTFRVFP